MKRGRTLNVLGIFGPPTGHVPVGWRPLCAGLHDAAAIDPRSSSRGRSDAVAYELHGLRHPDCVVAAGSFRYSWRTFWSPTLSARPTRVVYRISARSTTRTGFLWRTGFL